MNTETKFTGRFAKSCTGKNLHNVKVTYRIGDKVCYRYVRVNDEGAECSGLLYGTVTKIGVGTEYGMNGTTALAEVTLDGEAWDTGLKGTTRLVPARLLAHFIPAY